MSPSDLVADHPAFRQLAFERTCLGATLAAVLAVSYFAFILVIAFEPGVLGRPLHSGTVITWGVAVGITLICVGFLLTSIYVVFANRRLDALGDELRRALP